MQKIGTFLLLVGFAGMAIFGLFVMDFAMNHSGANDCLASRVSGNDTVCPMNLLQMAFHHISAFQAFSLSTVAFSFVFGLMFLFASLGLFIKILFFHPPRFLGRIRAPRTESSLFQKQKITGWLALFEHSPSLI